MELEKMKEAVKTEEGQEEDKIVKGASGKQRRLLEQVWGAAGGAPGEARRGEET